MEALSVPEFLFFSFVIILSYAIRGSAGFGGVTVPLLVWIMSLKTVAPMVAFLGLISSLAILLGLGILRVSGYIAVGAYDRDALLACAAALPLMMLGAFLGNRIHANLEQLRFKRFVAVVLIASGVPLVLR